MIPAVKIGATSLAAYSTGLDVAAHNLANLQTAGFKELRADYQEIGGRGGVRVAAIQPRNDVPFVPADAAGGAVDEDQALAASEVDIVSNLVGLLVAKHGFQFSAAVIRTGDELLRSTVNLVG